MCSQYRQEVPALVQSVYSLQLSEFSIKLEQQKSWTFNLWYCFVWEMRLKYCRINKNELNLEKN